LKIEDTVNIRNLEECVLLKDPKELFGIRHLISPNSDGPRRFPLQCDVITGFKVLTHNRYRGLRADLIDISYRSFSTHREVVRLVYLNRQVKRKFQTPRYPKAHFKGPFRRDIRGFVWSRDRYTSRNSRGFYGGLKARCRIYNGWTMYLSERKSSQWYIYTYIYISGLVRHTCIGVLNSDEASSINNLIQIDRITKYCTLQNANGSLYKI